MRNNNPKLFPGVYQIRCKNTGKIYIGQSGKIQSRVDWHFSQLKCGTHPIWEMQSDFNKYGTKNFIPRILQIIENREQRILFEKFMIKNCSYKKLYNLQFNEEYIAKRVPNKKTRINYHFFISQKLANIFEADAKESKRSLAGQFRYIMEEWYAGRSRPLPND